MGFTPQVVDLDGDGLMDILTGSYHPGHFYFFKRLQDGTFAKGEILRDKLGKQIVVGAASTPFAVDFDGDGDLDLVAGDIRGQVWVILNESGGKALKFGGASLIEHAGKVITAGRGDSQPVMIDLNGDKRLDLVLAHGDGAVTFYANTAKSGTPVFADPVTLVAAASGDTSESVPATRAKVSFTDYNQDGVLDMLLGDYAYSVRPAADLPADEKAEFDKLTKQAAELQQKQVAAFNEARRVAIESTGKKEADLTEAEIGDALGKELTKLLKDDEYKKLSKEYEAVSTALKKYPSTRSYRGYVWLYLGNKPEPAAE